MIQLKNCRVDVKQQSLSHSLNKSNNHLSYYVTEKTTTYDVGNKHVFRNTRKYCKYTVQPPHQTSLIPPYFCVFSKHRFKIYMASVVISVIRRSRLNLLKIKCLLHFFTFFFSDSLLSNGIHLGVIKQAHLIVIGWLTISTLT